MKRERLGALEISGSTPIPPLGSWVGQRPWGSLPEDLSLTVAQGLSKDRCLVTVGVGCIFPIVLFFVPGAWDTAGAL